MRIRKFQRNRNSLRENKARNDERNLDCLIPRRTLVSVQFAKQYRLSVYIRQIDASLINETLCHNRKRQHRWKGSYCLFLDINILNPGSGPNSCLFIKY